MNNLAVKPVQEVEVKRRNPRCYIPPRHLNIPGVSFYETAPYGQGSDKQSSNIKIEHSPFTAQCAQNQPQMGLELIRMGIIKPKPPTATEIIVRDNHVKTPSITPQTKKQEEGQEEMNPVTRIENNELVTGSVEPQLKYIDYNAKGIRCECGGYAEQVGCPEDIKRPAVLETAAFKCVLCGKRQIGFRESSDDS